MYRDIRNIVATGTRGGLVQHIQLPENITNGRFSWVPALVNQPSFYVYTLLNDFVDEYTRTFLRRLNIGDIGNQLKGALEEGGVDLGKLGDALKSTANSGAWENDLKSCERGSFYSLRFSIFSGDFILSVKAIYDPLDVCRDPECIYEVAEEHVDRDRKFGTTRSCCLLLRIATTAFRTSSIELNEDLNKFPTTLFGYAHQPQLAEFESIIRTTYTHLMVECGRMYFDLGWCYLISLNKFACLVVLFKELRKCYVRVAKNSQIGTQTRVV
ncbi:hypothetical protein CLF_106445 [Clonorchis sinensis]|uniref:Uncharacterized protein n=1 Tax=Clonorchis sinensis TaxID=79923 RepID=G7YF64_CLOSI|nr:hypothetical protein CLF_106445 [Clonorchis sinensis]